MLSLGSCDKKDENSSDNDVLVGSWSLVSVSTNTTTEIVDVLEQPGRKTMSFTANGELTVTNGSLCPGGKAKERISTSYIFKGTDRICGPNENCVPNILSIKGCADPVNVVLGTDFIILAGKCEDGCFERYQRVSER